MDENNTLNGTKKWGKNILYWCTYNTYFIPNTKDSRFETWKANEALKLTLRRDTDVLIGAKML